MDSKLRLRGLTFSLKKFNSINVILIHHHLVMLYNALTHTSHFICEVEVVMHLWQGYPPYRNFLRGGHLPNFCQNIKLTTIDFKAGSPAPAFSGLINSNSCIFNISFTGEVSFPIWL